MNQIPLQKLCYKQDRNPLLLLIHQDILFSYVLPEPHPLLSHQTSIHPSQMFMSANLLYSFFFFFFT